MPRIGPLVTSISLLFLGGGSPLRAAFGLSTSGSYYTIDSGAGLVFKIDRLNGSVPSIKLNGTELNDTAKTSSLASGLGSGGTTVSASAGADTIMITLSTDATNGVAAELTHYYIVRSGLNHIYMATYVINEPNVGELRWITRLQQSLFPNAPAGSDTRGTGETIESSDVFGMADGTTRSKYYGNQRAMDLSIRGVTGPGRGVFMAYGNRESSSGGPFFRDIQNQTTEVYNYMNSGHNQTEANRLGVLHGPYALVFTGGSVPVVPDMDFISGLGLTGYVDAAGRGAVAIPGISGRDTNFVYTVGFSNADAQYWTTASPSDGAATCSRVKPGSYAMNVYKGELSVHSSNVTVTAGATTTLPTLVLTGDPARTVPLWRIGSWDGTPLEFRNGTNIPLMHPSDTRQAGWVNGPFTIGSSALSEFPAVQWQAVNGAQYVNFNLTAGQIASYTVRIGITCAYAGGRPMVQVNSWSPSSYPPPSSQPSSRSLTIGTYRGNNTLYTVNIPASAFVVGENSLKISDISGSGGSGFLSPAYGIDCVEMTTTTGAVFLDVPAAPPGAAIQATAAPRAIVLSWNAAPGAASYEIRRATSADGDYIPVASNLTALTWTDPDVAAPGIYHYRLAAVNSSGRGAPDMLSIDPDGPGRPPAMLTWTGSQSAIWDMNTPNWIWSGGATYPYFPDDSVRFDDTGSVNDVIISGTPAPDSITVDAARNYTFSGAGVISGAAAFSKSGTGDAFVSAAHAFTGGTVIHAGSITLGNAAALGTGEIELAGGTLATGALAVGNPILVSAASRITGGHGGGNHAVKNIAGSGALTLEATTGVFDLEGSLAGFTGTVRLTGAGGFRFFGSAGSAAADFDLGTRGLSARSGAAFPLGSLTGDAGSTLGNNSSNGSNPVTFTIGANGKDTKFAGAIVNGGAKLTSLVKTGSGTLELSGANTYSGPTTVSQGTLEVTGSLGETAVTVAAAGTLAGNGTISGPLVCNGTLAPAPGGLSLSASLYLAPASIWNLDLGTLSGKVNVAGNLTLDGTLNISPAAGFGAGIYTIASYDGTLTDNTLEIGNLPPGYAASLSAATNHRIDLVVTSTGYANWETANFTPARILAGDSATTADPDADGLPNLAEYALGSPPGIFTPQPPVTRTGTETSITFQRPANLGDVSYHAESSDDLKTWEPLPLEVLNPGGDPETVRATTASAGPVPAKRFIRLRFVK